MAQLVAILARGILDDIYRGSKTSASDLIDAIVAAKTALLTNTFKSGRVFVTTSGSGQSASFLIPSLFTAEYTPVEVAKQLQEFIEIYNDAVSNSLITDQTNNDQDYAVMLMDDRLQTVEFRRLDITGIRFPVGVQGQ